MRKGCSLFMVVAICSVFASCSARYDISLLKGGAADIRFNIVADEAVMESMAEKAALFTGEETAGKVMAFDIEVIKAAAAGRRDLKILSIEETSSMSIKGLVSVPSLSALGKDEKEARSFFSYSEAKGTAHLRFRLARDNAAGLSDLLIGLDRDFVDLLAPPAIFGDELSEEEYAQALLPFFGKKDMPAFQAAYTEFRILAPGKLLSSEGGKVEGNTLIVKIPIMKALVLEKPIEFSLSWKL